MFYQSRTALVAALVLTGLAAQATAEPMKQAYDHFNASADGTDDLRTYPQAAEPRLKASARSQSPVWMALRHLNADADSASDVTGQQGVTAISNRPAHGAAIFESIRREGLEDE